MLPRGVTSWWWVLSVLAVLLFASGCGGRRGHGGDDDDDDVVQGGTGSGLPRGDAIVDLGPTELEDLCAWSADLQGGEGSTHDCGGGLTVTTKTVPDCVDSMSQMTCDITVGEVEDCTSDLAPDPCAVLEQTPASCLPLLQCQ